MSKPEDLSIVDHDAKKPLVERTAKYREYLKSPAWLDKREMVFERDQYLCQGCRRNKAEHCHHLTYNHIYDELLFELISLCDWCHRRAHKLP